jgi:hypothetical protein
MLRLRRFIAPIVLASCLIAGATLTPALALIDRGEPPVVLGPIILDSMRDAGHDWGWLGLLGLTGLAGLLGRAPGNPRTDFMSGRERRPAR